MGFGVTDFDTTLEKFRTRFLARAADDLVRLRRHQLGPALSKPELIGLVHRIAGNAGMFGYPKVSTLASDVELRLDSDADATLALGELVAALQETVADKS